MFPGSLLHSEKYDLSDAERWDLLDLGALLPEK